MFKISIINPGGVDNYGERAILLGTIYDLKNKYPISEVYLFGYQNVADFDVPLSEELKKNEVRLLPNLISGRNKFSKLLKVFLLLIKLSPYGRKDLKLLRKSDLVVAKGQESLVSSYGFIHFIDSIVEPYIASFYNKNVVLYGHSIGPISNKKEYMLAGHIVTRIKHIYIRDAKSKSVLKKIGYPNVQTTLIKDLAYTAILNNKLWQEERPLTHYLIIPNAALPKNSTERKIYIKNLDLIIKTLLKSNNIIHLASSVSADDWNNDYKICEQLHKNNPRCDLVRYDGLNDLLADIKSAKKVISSRLHPIIMSDALGTEFIAYTHSPKVVGLLADIGKKQFAWDPFLEIGKATLRKI